MFSKSSNIIKAMHGVRLYSAVKGALAVERENGSNAQRTSLNIADARITAEGLEASMGADLPSQKQIATLIAESISPADSLALKGWMLELLDIRNSDLPALQKAKKAVNVTVSNKVLWPMTKIISREVKRHAWDNRSAMVRRSYAGAALALATVGGGQAGIAAMGGAIAVPLWVVFGAGAAFAPILIDALREASRQESRASEPSTTAEKTIEAEWKEIT